MRNIFLDPLVIRVWTDSPVFFSKILDFFPGLTFQRQRNWSFPQNHSLEIIMESIPKKIRKHILDRVTLMEDVIPIFERVNPQHQISNSIWQMMLLLACLSSSDEKELMTFNTRSGYDSKLEVLKIQLQLQDKPSELFSQIEILDHHFGVVKKQSEFGFKKNCWSKTPA